MEVGKIFVGGLNHETNKDGLKRHFSAYGEVTDCVVMTNGEGNSRGFGFVTFADPDAVTAVLANQVHEIDGKVVDPKHCSARGANNASSKGSRPTYTGRTTKIFIGGLPNDATDESLTSFFNQYGKVVDVVIMRDQETKKPRGFGFLTFDSETAVDKASDDHYVNFNGKQVEIKKAEPRQGGGSGGGRRQNYNQDQQQGWGDGGWNQNQSYNYQQSTNSYGGYGNQGFDPNWSQSQNYNQQNWQQSQSYPTQGYNQQQYGGQSYGNQGYSNGQSYGSSNYGTGPYGGYGAQGYGNTGYSNTSYGNTSYGGNQGYGQGSSGHQGYSQGSSGHQGYSGTQGYGGSDGYGGSSGGGKTSSGGSSQGYHPYKR